MLDRIPYVKDVQYLWLLLSFCAAVQMARSILHRRSQGITGVASARPSRTPNGEVAERTLVVSPVHRNACASGVQD